MTTTRLARPTSPTRALATLLAVAVCVLVLGACGSTPYAADAGSATTPVTGGGAAGATGGDPGGTGGTTPSGMSGTPTATPPGIPPDMPTDPPLTHGPVPDPDTAVSATDLPGRATSSPAITGRVTDASGKPVSGLLVSVVSQGDPQVAVPEIAVLTGADGRYAWPALPPGQWKVQVTRDGRTASAGVTLEAGRTATADLIWR